MSDIVVSIQSVPFVKPFGCWSLSQVPVISLDRSIRQVNHREISCRSLAYLPNQICSRVRHQTDLSSSLLQIVSLS